MLVGRHAERARIGALLEAAHASRSGALVLCGEPGIGKTALLEDAREQAADMHVLTARGLESESELAFAGLHQLLRPALHLVDELPGPQSVALQAALGLAERAGDDRFLISAACLTLLSELAEERPVLCLVDDAHWLDTPSADALVFVARRLGADGIAMLFAARAGEEHRFETRELPKIELGELDAGSAASMLASRVQGTLDERVRDLLLERARGNALALIELPAGLSAAQLAGEELLPEALPLTRDLQRLYLERIDRLPPPTQQVLLVVAADTTGRLPTVVRAAETLRIDDDALGPAEQAGVVSVRGTTVSLRHPLVRSAVYQSAASTERRAVHLALADALDGEDELDERAWHRAAAAHGPDADVADELERAAERARLRSGHAAAAAGLERAAQLSVDDESRGRRLVGAASAAWHAGQPERAMALLAHAHPFVVKPDLRAELAHIRGQLELNCGSAVDAGPILIAGATEIAPLDPRKALEMLFDAASAGTRSGNFAFVAEVGELASALPRTESAEELFIADLLAGVGSLMGAKTDRNVSLVQDLIARAHEVSDPRLLVWATAGAGAVGDQAKEAELMRRAVELARESAAVDTLAYALMATASAGVVTGRTATLPEATEGLRLATDAHLRNLRCVYLGALAWFAAVRGHEDECRTYASEVAETARRAGVALAYATAEWALALLDLNDGRPKQAATRLESMRTAPVGTGHPYIALVAAPDLIEACVRTGAREQAAIALESFEAFAEPEGLQWARALAARCRALIAHAEGARARAEGEFITAMELHSESDRPFDRARTALLYGEFLRRERRRVEARKQLRAALEAFETLGAQPWAERARAELRASGETARKRDPSTIDQLTPQELQIARFVADGLSNKEVAALLFLSPRTIDYHLRNVFVKLGITSRTQLAGIALGESRRPSSRSDERRRGERQLDGLRGVESRGVEDGHRRIGV